MIDITNLANELKKTLEIADNHPINELIPGTRFQFHISCETAEYRLSELDEDNPNNVTEYICGVLKALPGATHTGYSNNDYVGSLPASLELLIPHCDLEEDGESKILNQVLAIIEAKLTHNQQFAVLDSKPIIPYQITAAYSPPYVSAREIRPEVGDSVIVTVQALYAIVAHGLGPDDATIAYSATELSIEAEGWERIYTTQLNVARSTQADGNLFNDDSSGSAKCTCTGSRLVITVNGAVRGSSLDKAMLKHIVTGEIPEFYIKLRLGEYEAVKKMTFLDTEAAIQTPSIPGSAYSLVEVV